jgi:hypothetical protein
MTHQLQSFSQLKDNDNDNDILSNEISDTLFTAMSTLSTLQQLRLWISIPLFCPLINFKDQFHFFSMQHISRRFTEMFTLTASSGPMYSSCNEGKEPRAFVAVCLFVRSLVCFR